VRARLLRAYEEAETTADAARRRALLTTIVIGGGPTGVEMAGAIAELSRYTLTRDFRRIDPGSARILLLEGGPRLLAAFPEELGAYAARALTRLGVEVRLDTMVEAVDADGVVADGVAIPASTVVWGAGIRAAKAAKWLGATPDRLGRLRVNPDLSVAGYERVYAVGDVAAAEQDGRPLPALAQVATQQGRHLGRALAKSFRTGEPVEPFRYASRGDTAVIGRHAAVYSLGRWRLKGVPAWALWALVHIYLLITFEQRLLVAIQWTWRYFTYQRGARLID
jgi:NADH dehydrogenase